jgi:hypothetical protein
MGNELAGLKHAEKFVDAEVKNVPANQRENVKQQKLNEIQKRRAELTARMKEWQTKIDEAEKRVNFDGKPSAAPSNRSSEAAVEPAGASPTAQPGAAVSNAAVERAGGAPPASSARAESAVAPAAGTPPPKADISAPVPPLPSKKTLAFALGGLGIAGLATGTVTLILGIHKANVGDANCSDEARLCTREGHDANQSPLMLGTISTISFAVGAAGLAASTYLFLSANHRSGSRTGFAVAIDRSGAGGAVVREF